MLFAKLAQKRLARFVFARRDAGLAVLYYASNHRGREDLVPDHDRDGPVHVRPGKILETPGRLGCELDQEPAAAWVLVNLRFALDYERREVRCVEHKILAFVLPNDMVPRLPGAFHNGVDAVRDG